MFLNLKIFLIALLWSGYFHPIHVSITNMEIKDDEDISLSVKVFLDDFTNILQLSENVSINFSDSVSVSENSNYIIKYFAKNLILEFDNHQFGEFVFESWKRNEDAGWFSISVRDSKGIIPDRIKNTILLDLYPDQTNLLIIGYGKKEFGYRFDFRRTYNELNL